MGEALVKHFYINYRTEIKRYHLDKEILRLDIESTELSGTIADRRRAISKSRNQKLLKKIESFEAEMRTRRLTCPLPAHRKQLETEYFEKSVKKTIPRWFNKLRQWQENRSNNEENNT